jgi:O-antigen/teichoic acid export membrane protein
VQYFSFTFLEKKSRTFLATTSLVEIVAVFFSFTPIFLTEKFLAIDKLGIYNYAFLISSSALMLVVSISASSFPLISRLKSENKTGEILKLIISLRFLNTIFIFIFIPLFFLIYKYFLYYFGNSLHNDSKNYIFFFLLCHLVLSFFSLNTNLLFIFNYQKKIVRNYLMSILIVSPLFLHLINNYGVTGSVLVYFFLSISFAIINEITICKIFKKNIFFDIFLFKKNFLILKKIFKFYFLYPLKK